MARLRATLPGQVRHGERMDEIATDRQFAAGTSPYEALYGFARAHRIGDHLWVSGTAPVEADGSSTPGGAEAQAVSRPGDAAGRGDGGRARHRPRARGGRHPG